MRKIMFVLLLATLVACSGGGGEKKTMMAPSKGLPSELLLVVDEGLWQSDIKDSINAIVEAQVPGLMSAEKMFRVTRIFSKGYSATYTTFHTKLIVRLDKSLKQPMLGLSRNEYAVPQLQLLVAAPTKEALREFLPKNAEKIIDILTDFQIEMRVAQLKKKFSKKVDDDLKAVLGMSIRVPDNMRATKKGENFLWGGTNLLEKDLNIVVYTYDWHGENIADAHYFADKRDSVMERNIPGDKEGQWMETVREKVNNSPLVTCKSCKLNGKQVVESRGLWQMRNGALGGPFVCLSRVDTTANKVIVAEGFVYSPSTDKRDLIRQMEAALRTLK